MASKDFSARSHGSHADFVSLPASFRNSSAPRAASRLSRRDYSDPNPSKKDHLNLKIQTSPLERLLMALIWLSLEIRDRINPPPLPLWLTRVIDFYSQQFLQVSRNIIRYIRTTRIFIKKKKEYNPHLLLILPFLKEILFSFWIVFFFENFKN